MSSIKSDSEKINRTPLNTTIKSDVLVDFKKYAKESGMPMNVLIELFMQGMIDGRFELVIGKASELKVDISE